VTASGKAFSYRMHYLLRFCDVIDNIATLTTFTAVSAFGTFSVKDKSLGVEALVRIKVVIISGLGLTTPNFIYLYVGFPEEIRHHVWFEGFDGLPT
jgi:hypothetical protein